MQLDRNRSYGTVVGHPEAKFEQDGRLFNGAGEPLAAFTESFPENVPDTAITIDLKLENAMEFLKTCLATGPVDKSVLWKACKENNQEWDTVTRAFNAMGGTATKKGGSLIWSLPAKEVA